MALSVASSYRGRFAPSPTGPLHAGSLVAALASWLDARAHGGTWIVRIEDVDTPRCVPGADRLILQQLATCGLVSDEPAVWQSERGALYLQALNQLVATDRAYPCGCSRKDIEAALHAAGLNRERHHAAVYPGTCRPENGGLQGKPARAWRFAVPSEPAVMTWTDRRLGPQAQNVAREVGDFILRRADGLWAYQLAVVVDDAAQGITHVVRGEDLADNTPRQIALQRALGLPLPAYLHTPLVLGANGEKLSKQNGAQALDLSEPMEALNQAAAHLGLPVSGEDVGQALTSWVGAWALDAGPVRA
ncbi:tRNA glutamyl-Q(34) synthetase GluQRS [Hydrogenophaga aromaticivorans]|uniref:tRNA glutamyl-Q(34) synthetase GluQRS n=1 Tax=Hydrogenophaga aromaticivorans TaxID=2610898 RepID=UPI001B374B9B|nr:tRNA glutamyl-Q(34) synthetase GluQRS [Hydrogenophaga aromaticivorans]MBQ0917575.1 tRNA glutamyl-Q(34) synthetase GluQRS [Hydrogenophaga aromaticivorans]